VTSHAPPRTRGQRGGAPGEPPAGDSATPLDGPPRGAPERGAPVRLVIIGTGVLFVAMVGALYYRWVTTVVPTSILSVYGNERLDGAVVTVAPAGAGAPAAATSRHSSATMEQSEMRPLVAVLDKQHGYGANFYLEPGVYRATLRLEGRTLSTPEFSLGPRQIYKWDLHTWGMPRELTAQPGENGRQPGR